MWEENQNGDIRETIFELLFATAKTFRSHSGTLAFEAENPPQAFSVKPCLGHKALEKQGEEHFRNSILAFS